LGRLAANGSLIGKDPEDNIKSIGAILVNSNAKLELAEFDIIMPLKHGQVLISMISAGVCGTQIREIKSPDGPDKFLPHLIGHEGFARVIEVGSGVTKVKPDDFVVVHWRRGAGIGGSTPDYVWNKQKLNAGPVAVFATKVVTLENRITKIEKNIDPLFAPLLGCALTTGWGVVNRELTNSGITDNLLVIGVGGIGLSVLICAQAKNYASYSVIDSNTSNLHAAIAIGAKNFESNGGERALFEKIIDTTGNSLLIESAVSLLSDNGELVLVGMNSDQSKVRISPNEFLRGISIRGSNGGNSNPTLDIPLIAQQIRSGLLPLKDYPIHLDSFENINDVLDHVREGRGGRSVIKFDL
jgi:Zn-dependent alcohol dehydrogenase